MVTQHFDHPTLTHATVTAFLDHSLQLIFQGPQLFKSAFNLNQLFTSNAIDRFATRLRMIRKNQQLANCFNWKPQFPSMSNESQSFDILSTVQSVSTFRAFEWLNEANFLIVSYSWNPGRGYFRQLSNRQSTHDIFSLNLQRTEVVASPSDGGQSSLRYL